MASKRETPILNLQPELPEVVSRDINLFYKPDPVPMAQGQKELLASLDNFINNGLMKKTMIGEMNLKTESEAEAIKKYNETRMKFNELVASNNLPKEANPYFIAKYKDLELGDKSKQFKTYLIDRYGELGVKDNFSPDGFTSFYNSSLKQFVKDNQLLNYEPTDLATSFFNRTEKIKNELFNAHSNAQLSKVGEQYKKGFINNLQGFFETYDNTPDGFKKMGEAISNFVKDKTLNGLPNASAQDYFLEALNAWVKSTNDTDYAFKLLQNLPNHIKFSTDYIGNIKGLKDNFNKIQDDLLNRELDLEKQKVNKENILYSSEERLIRSEVNKENFDALDFKNSEAYKKLSGKGKKYFEDYYSKVSGAFANHDSLEVQKTLQNYLVNNKFNEAEKYLLEVGSKQLTKKTFDEYYVNIITTKDTKKYDGIILSDKFQALKNDIDTKVKALNKNGILVESFLANKFEQYARQWVLDHIDEYPKRSDLIANFDKAMIEQYNIYKQTVLVGSSITSTNPNTNNVNQNQTGTQKREQADLTKIKSNNNVKPEVKSSEPTVTFGGRQRQNIENNNQKENQQQLNKDLGIDLTKVVIIPSNLKGNQLTTFKRENPNAISKEEFNRILKVQEDYKKSQQIAQLNNQLGSQ